jgi:hypothetical protein
MNNYVDYLPIGDGRQAEQFAAVVTWYDSWLTDMNGSSSTFAPR